METTGRRKSEPGGPAVYAASPTAANSQADAAGETLDIPSLVRRAGGVVFPLEGRFSLDGWAKILRCSRQHVLQYMKRLDVKYRRSGDLAIIDAEDFWNAIPEVRESSIVHKRGGHLRKAK